MKDFHDLHWLAENRTFLGVTLVRAVRATFQERRTPFPTSGPVALTPEFLADPRRVTQWRAFLRRGRLELSPDPDRLLASLRSFLLPVLAAAAVRTEDPGRWAPKGPWMTTAG